MKCYLIEHLKNDTWMPIELRAEPLDLVLSARPDQRARRMRTATEAMLYRRRFNLDTVIHPALVERGEPIIWEIA